MSNERNILFDTNAGINPVGAVFNVDANDLCDFIVDYLTSKGIDGVTTASVYFRPNGEVAMYVFVSTNSKAIESSKSRAPKNLAHKLETSNEVRLSDSAKGIFAPICYDKIKLFRSNKVRGEVYIALNIFYCLGLYLKATPSRHKIRILETATTKDDKKIISVCKQDASTINCGTRPFANQHDRAIEEAESRNERNGGWR